MNRKKCGIITGIVFAAMMLMANPSNGSGQVQAADAERVMQLRTKGIERPVTKSGVWSGDYVYYNDDYFYMEQGQTQVPAMPAAVKYSAVNLRKYDRTAKDSMMVLQSGNTTKQVSVKSIAFSCAAVNGKISDFNNGEELTPVSVQNVSEWKLTIKNPYDEKTNPQGLREPEIDNIQKTNHMLTFDYKNLYSTGNCYLSAIVLTKGENEIIGYDRLVSAAERGNGTVAIHWPSEYDRKGYVLKVFAEQYNGDYNTDYISDMQFIHIGFDPDANDEDETDYQKYSDNILDCIDHAGEGGVAAYYTEIYMSFPASTLQYAAAGNVTLEISYLDEGQKQNFTLTTDQIKRILSDGEKYYGFRFLKQESAK